jgi:hypothetical protein
VPADVTRCLSFAWDMRDLLSSVGCLFDRVTGSQGDFAAVLDSLRTDKDGPQVDLQADVVGQLTGRVTVIGDCPAQVPDRGDRTLIAVQARDGQRLAEAVGRLLEGEDGVRTRKFQGQAYWEIQVKSRKLKDGTEIHLPNMAVAVAGGRLLFSNHVALLEKVLFQSNAPLVKDADYLAVDAELRKLAPADTSFRVFSRPAKEIRGTYTLAKDGRLKLGDSVSARLLRGALSTGGLQLNPATMPPFEKVAGHLKPFGAAVVTAPGGDGWDAVGFTLKARPKP